jgi:kynurenine formamidase
VTINGDRPRYRSLRGRVGYPDGSSWGLWGEGDEIGALNDVPAQCVARAAGLVSRGRVFALNWRADLPSPGLFGRGPMRHTIRDDGFAMDDYYDCFWPQQSSQWDSLAHFRHPRHGFYGGRDSRQLTGPSAMNGIHNWARRGMAGRFVLADVAAWRAAAGRPIDIAGAEAIPVDDVAATLAWQGTSLQPGDFLLLRFGWTRWYESLSQAERDALPADGFTAVGLAPGEACLGWLWDSGVVAVAGDNPAVEAYPFDVHGASLHADLLALLGVALGELWFLDELARDSTADGRYTGLLVSAPLYIPGGIGSPANAIALK